MEESEESTNRIEWNKLLKGHHIDGNYIHGYVTSEASVYTVLELHKRVTTTTFSVRDSSSLQFNPVKVDKEKLKFSPRSIFYSKSRSPRITDDGVPFVFGGKKILECQFGPMKVHKKKCEKKEENDALPSNNDSVLDHDYAPRSGHTTTNNKQRFHIQDTRKKGCEAKITIKQICRFPQYMISCKKNLEREQKKTKERLLKDLREGKEVDFESRYYLELPLNKAHTKHTLGGISGMTQTVHPTITQWINQLVKEGMTDSQEIQATLRHYVKTRMTDTAAPSEMDRAYYPTLKDIKNHIYLAKVRLRITKLDQQDLCQKLDEWQKDGACTSFRPSQNEKPTTVSAADKSVQDGSVGGDGHTDGVSNPLNISKNSPAESAQELNDSGDMYADALPRRKRNRPPEPAANKSRKKAHDALETLRAMTYKCTNDQALDALTAEIEALTLTLKEFLDESPERLALLPHSDPHSHRGNRQNMETDPTPLPLVKATAGDGSDYTYRSSCGVKAAKLVVQQERERTPVWGKLDMKNKSLKPLSCKPRTGVHY
ncbi:hypothetical protein PAMP_021310 [Pampus punctatissimus]